METQQLIKSHQKLKEYFFDDINTDKMCNLMFGDKSDSRLTYVVISEESDRFDIINDLTKIINAAYECDSRVYNVEICDHEVFFLAKSVNSLIQTLNEVLH